MKKEIFDPKEKDYFVQCTEYIQNSLRDYDLKPKDRMSMELLCEESLIRLADNMTEGSMMEIGIRRSFGKVIVEMKAKGEEISVLEPGGNISIAAESLDNEDSVRDLIFKAYSQYFRYSNRSGVNRVRILSGSNNRNRQLIWTLGALVLSILAGLLCRMLLPHDVNSALCKYAFSPLKTMFINALKIVVGPVVFFSIVTCISDFKDLSELGKIGAKVMLMYLLTTFLAIMIGIAMFTLINPGEWGMAL
ncbi:MAG: dicarboxylate/amino acid:cation symporter, partial [Lachnospiraceae bacterium]|nr:dicarboxylate/amino acid:cation symporter [Lachnospiraceae bacterium]